MARIFSLGACLLLLFSLFSWPKPVLAGASVWSAESIPTRLNNMLGPVGVDIRDYSIGSDLLTIYAVPGDSITDAVSDNRVVFKSVDGGANWTALAAPIKADLVAVAPDNNNLVVIATGNTTAIFISFNGGITWQTMGAIKDPIGAAAVVIYDIKISPARSGIQYIAAAGKEAGNIANLWYFDYGAPTQGWHETNTFNGFAADNETAEMEFSPDFLLDATLVIVTDNAGADVRLQMLNINTGTWNAAAGYVGYPCVVVNNAGFNNLTSASLALAPTYEADDPNSRKVFIGITVNGTAAANATSGIYRFIDITNTNILADVKVHSVSFNNAYLIAGCYDTTIIYRSTNPLSTTPTFYPSTATKHPGGENRGVIAWLGSNVIVGTSGEESAFAKSIDNGVIFNDISLIDTSILNAQDVAVSTNGNKVYFVTDNGTHTSVWRRASEWKRVFSLQNSTGYIIRIEASAANIIYLVQKGGTTIYYNSSGGEAQWFTRNCIINVQDMAVENTQNAYVLNAAGSVTKTVNNGVSWTVAVPTTLASGATIVSVRINTILVGSQNGFVAYSLNGGTIWTVIPQPIAVGAGNVQVVADEDFVNNNIIYAACDTAGQNIMTWTIGTSTAWKDIFNGIILGGIYGLAITNNILYALEYNDAPGVRQSTLWRHISPATAEFSSNEWNSSTTTATTDIDDNNVRMNATPRALKVSAGKLWAVKTNLTNKLYSYTDVILDVTISLTQPIQDSTVSVNSLTGVAYDVLFSWARPSVATQYELFIAFDEDFLIPVTTVIVTTNNTLAFVLVGPQQAGNAFVNFIPGEIYYWKIRVTQPGFSPYSITRHFSIEPLTDMSAQTMVQGQSGMITGTSPAFSWQPLQGVTEYQFMLSDNPEMTEPLMDANVKTTAVKVDITLERGKTYFWRVRAIKPSESAWSALVTFTVAEEPVESQPVVTFEEGEPVTFTLPPITQQALVVSPPGSPTIVTPGYFHVIIFIMAVLLGLVAVLLTGRSPRQLFVPRGRKAAPTGPARKIRIPDERPARPIKRAIDEEEEEAEIPPTIEKSKEGAATIFAAKSLMWMLMEGKRADESQAELSEKEEQALGKKVADRIRALTKKENLYIKHPEDAVMLLRIWRQYGSRDETSRYLIKTFSASPANAIRLLRCFLPFDKEPSADDFSRTHYDSVAGVVDPDKVYAALTKVFKFKVHAIEEKAPVKPVDRNLAFKFMRLHLQIKSEKQKGP